MRQRVIAPATHRVFRSIGDLEVAIPDEECTITVPFGSVPIDIRFKPQGHRRRW